MDTYSPSYALSLSNMLLYWDNMSKQYLISKQNMIDGLLQFAIFIPPSDRLYIVSLISIIADDIDNMFHNIVFRCIEKDIRSQKPRKVVETIKYLVKIFCAPHTHNF